MKLHYNRPGDDLIIVRPDNEGDEYEYYSVHYTLLGTAHRAGVQRVICEGKHFTNLRSAGQFLLEQAGDHKLAATVKSYVNEPTRKIMVKGLDLAARDVWGKFCRMRDLAPSSDSINKTYVLTQAEAEQLGINEQG